MSIDENIIMLDEIKHTLLKYIEAIHNMKSMLNLLERSMVDQATRIQDHTNKAVVNVSNAN